MSDHRKVRPIPASSDGTAASGRGVQFSDLGENGGEQVVSGWQSQGELSAVTDQAGWDAEQSVSQAGCVGAAAVVWPVDPGECLEQHREVPGQERGPHPHRVDCVVPGGEPAECGAELGFTDAVLMSVRRRNQASTSRIVSALPVWSPGRSLAGMLVTMKETA